MELTRSQKAVLLKIKQKKNIFLQGVAGTGKTFLLKNLSKLTEEINSPLRCRVKRNNVF